jgi:TorA maturation chaperone TorD
MGVDMDKKKSEDTSPTVPFQRSRVYELLSHALGEPTGELLEFIKGGGFLSFIQEALEEHPLRKQVDVRVLRQAASECSDADEETVSSWYERLVSPRHHLLYECRYHAPLGTFEEMSDIAGFYRAFGLGYEGERADHVSLELEFMRLLALKEARALMDKEAENTGICRSAQREFLQGHLGRWAGNLAHVAEGVGFYHPLLRFLGNWISAECGHLGAKPEEAFHSFSDRDIEEPSLCLKEARQI